MSNFPGASYDAWKTREPDWDDDPCAEVRYELGQEIDERDRIIADLRSVLIDAIGLILGTPASEQRDALVTCARETLGLPDPNRPVEQEIAF